MGKYAKDVEGVNKIAKPVRDGKRGEVVIRGYHPEMALLHSYGYDHKDPYLESHPKEKNLRYNGPKPIKLDDPRPM